MVVPALGRLPLASSIERLRPNLWLLPLVALALVLYTWGVATNPPGFYLDEASISYNALTISTEGRDEHGVAWPLFFQTWDTSVAVNPVYVYTLAVVFKLFGPSILAARLLSAVAGFLAGTLLGVLAGRMTGNREAAWIVGGSALLTPWLFQVGRLVFEVALFPLVLVLVLLLIHRVHAKAKWSVPEVVALGGLLGLLSYTYTIGRLLGPMLAFGLILFTSRSRATSILMTWIVFGLTLLPALAFNIANAGALSARAGLLGYIQPGVPLVDIGATFITHVLANLDPRRLLLLGDPNIRHHVPVMGSILGATLALAVLGLDRVAHGSHRDPFVRYLVYGLLASLVPASLTIDDFHTLRLIAFPIFLLLLAGLGTSYLAPRPGVYRYALWGLAGLTVAQAAAFQVGFWRHGPDRGAAFDEAFPGVFEAALATGASPIYLRDLGNVPGYIEAYWYGALRGMDRSAFVRLPPDQVPPAGAIVLGTDQNCGSCEVLAQDGDYIAYRAAELSSAGLIPNGDFEAVGATPFESFGAAVAGWSPSPDAALLADGARTDGAHLALGHVTDAEATKQVTSSIVTVSPEASLLLDALVRPGRANQGDVTVTVALVELDAARAFVTWHTSTTELTRGGDWQQVRLGPVVLSPEAAFVQVAIYLEPGGALGDQVEVDDVVLSLNP